MSKPIDRPYYIQRIAQERARAIKASGRGAAAVHRELAKMYEELLASERSDDLALNLVAA